MTKMKTKKNHPVYQMCLDRGWTIARLSRETYNDGEGVTITTISKVIHGASCSDQTKYRIARALGVTVEELFK